jgi:tetratricopeptide (TPR) repeat protein
MGYMGNDSDLQKIQRTIDNARSEINRQKARRAIRLLKAIKDEIELYKGTPESVDYSLTLAEAYSAMKDYAMAETFFEEAEEKAADMPVLAPVFGMRLYEHLGANYARAKKLTPARASYGRAKEFALRQHFEEDTARIQLSLECVGLQEKNNRVELENLQKLRKVADGDSVPEVARESFTCTEQMKAWNVHKGLPRDALFARIPKERDEAYFLNLLRSVRKDQEDTEDHGEQPSLFP